MCSRACRRELSRPSPDVSLSRFPTRRVRSTHRRLRIRLSAVPPFSPDPARLLSPSRRFLASVFNVATISFPGGPPVFRAFLTLSHVVSYSARLLSYRRACLPILVFTVMRITRCILTPFPIPSHLFPPHLKNMLRTIVVQRRLTHRAYDLRILAPL